MRDAFELLDLCVYLIGVALILPVIPWLGRDRAASMFLLIGLFLPFPIYLVRCRGRITFPDWVEAALERLAVLTFCAGLLVFLAVAVLALV